MCWFKERHVKDMIGNIDNEKGIKMIQNQITTWSEIDISEFRKQRNRSEHIFKSVLSFK